MMYKVLIMFWLVVFGGSSFSPPILIGLDSDLARGCLLYVFAPSILVGLFYVLVGVLFDLDFPRLGKPEEK